jgi:5'-3' exonuclease
MGIKGLGSFLKENVDEKKTWEMVPLERLRGHRVAIDMLNTFHPLLVSAYGIHGRMSPSTIPVHEDVVRTALGLFFRILESLVGYGIVPIVVCDGVATKLKAQTQSTRRKQTDKYATQQVDAEIRAEKIKIEHSKPKPVPQTKEEALDQAANELVVQSELVDLNKCIVKCVKGSVRVSDTEKAKVRDFVYYLGIPFVQAEEEAEKTCAQLVKEGQCIASLSNDSDMLVHGCPAVITRLENGIGPYTYNEARIVMLCNVLVQLDLTLPAFVDFCIMCGTDYNPNVPGYGPKTCMALITKYGSLDNMPDIVDPHTLDINRVPKGVFVKSLLCNIVEDKSYVEIRREFLEGRADIDTTTLELDECMLSEAANLCDERLTFERFGKAHSDLMNTTTYKVPFSVEECSG